MLISIAGITLKIMFQEGLIIQSSYLQAMFDFCSAQSATREEPFKIEITMDPNSIPFVAQDKLKPWNGLLYCAIGSDFYFCEYGFACFIAFSRSRATIALRFNPNEQETEIVCTDFLKLVAAYLILKKGGIILHGSAVFNQGESLVFLAPSGGGKSTIASLLKNQWRLFNDECNAVLPVDSGFQIHAMPFARPENLPRCNPGSAMLKKIFILEQAENNSVRPLSLSQRVAGILANIYLNPISEELEETMLRTIEAIAQSIPVEILAFKNTPAIASDITHFL